MLTLALEFPKHFSVRVLLSPSIQYPVFSVYKGCDTWETEFLSFPVKIPFFQTINSFNEIMDTMKQNHFNELLK